MYPQAVAALLLADGSFARMGNRNDPLYRSHFNADTAMRRRSVIVAP
jgi:hypothetical protein